MRKLLEFPNEKEVKDLQQYINSTEYILRQLNSYGHPMFDPYRNSILMEVIEEKNKKRKKK